MEAFCYLVMAAYAGFATGAGIQMYKTHKKWEEEMLPLVRENSRLKCLLELAGK